MPWKCWQAAKPELSGKRLLLAFLWLPPCIVRIRCTRTELHLATIHIPQSTFQIQIHLTAAFSNWLFPFTTHQKLINIYSDHAETCFTHPCSLCQWCFSVIVYFSGPIQLSLDVFLAQLSMSLHTSFVCNLMWYATRLHFFGGSIWGLVAFQLQSFLSLSLFFSLALRNCFGDDYALPCLARSCRILSSHWEIFQLSVR